MEQIKAHKIEIAFDDDALQRMKILRESAKVETDGHLIRNALVLYEWYLARKKEGADVGLIANGRVSRVDLKFD